MIKVIAHRGSKGTHPENTLPAFQEAIDIEADGIELDVQLTRDGQLVVIHDEKINRTTNAKGWVKDLTVAEIKELDAGSWFAEEYKDTSIPTLEEVLNLLKHNRFSGLLNIELKTDRIEYLGIEQKVLRALEQADLSCTVVLSSFNRDTVRRLKALNTTYEKAFISFGNQRDVAWLDKQREINSFHPDIRWLRRHIDQTTDIEIIRPWTVNKESDMQFCIKHQLAGMFTDFPKKALEVRDNG
ncbi:glycerophosphodiester phosphodiesterase [Vagococcus luciliae]|uniref:Glycerophosphodiester phosphodiesterase n=1 Tax=Vagococcus luciliae TaxID=2920380 RepID=A0ABY5P0R3_9ENTE|nr:glycerophosphodiester phosphodiesterase [Vagococcus luciliae]UUV99509.1 Glycerophosphodiester phosphodiesterase [Vagococcus luciliae]